MKRIRFTEEQIIGVLREQEAGAKTADLARQIGRLRTSLLLAQNPDDLLFREPDPLHSSVPPEGPDSKSTCRKYSVAGHPICFPTDNSGKQPTNQIKDL